MSLEEPGEGARLGTAHRQNGPTPLPGQVRGDHNDVNNHNIRCSTWDSIHGRLGLLRNEIRNGNLKGLKSRWRDADIAE